jgi:hypothetical protein
VPLNNPLSQAQRAEFLKNSGWDCAEESPVGEDWSQRKFFRIEKGGKTAIVMHAVPDDDPRATPGHKLRDFISISGYLRQIGLSVPEVYAQDLHHGLLLVEDFGNQDFAGLIPTNKNREHDLYLLAAKTLAHIYSKTEFIAIDLPDYYAGHVHKGRQRVVDWYMPAMLERSNPDGLVEDYLSVWKSIEKKLPRVKRRLLHGDFHPANMMWLPERVGIQQTGLIDFQGAMMGPAPYDLVNLLDDARRDVPQDIRDACLNQFLAGMAAEDRESFEAWYPVLAAQFHCRVIGQALRLAILDGKTRLLTIIPILRRHLIRDLSSPVLKPLKDWFDAQGVDFSDVRQIDPAKAAKFIRPDAF